MPDPAAAIDLIDHAIRDWETSPDAMRWGPDVKPEDPEPDPYDALYAHLRQVFEQASAAMTAFGRNMADMFEAIAASLQSLAADELAHADDARSRPSWHKRRCTRCNPRCALTPAWSYGREYHRRLRSRARRRR